MIFFLAGILPVNIDNLLLYLPGTSNFGIGLVVALSLLVGSMSIIVFGYLGGKFSKSFSRKKLFIITNCIWVGAYGLVSLSLNYNFYLFFIICTAIGTGAFLPIGFSIISDFFSPGQRGKMYGLMQFGLILGSGGGIILGGLLGSYAGPHGWRFAYGLGFILGFLALLNYIFSGSDPESGKAEPEFEGLEDTIDYDYKISLTKLGQIIKKRTVLGILLFTLCAGIANSTLGTWAIFYLTNKIVSEDSSLIATTIYLLSGMGALPGTIIGGRLGDAYVRKGKMRGRIYISLFGLLIGVPLFIGFYLIPFFTATTIEIILSWVFFILIGFTASFLTSLPGGNIFAIYSEVNVPELRSTVNSFNGLMGNFGAIIGNLLLSSMIQENISLLPLAITVVLSVQLVGSLFWIIPCYFYPKEHKELRDLMKERKKDLETR